jgi:hypothetical protein
MRVALLIALLASGCAAGNDFDTGPSDTGSPTDTGSGQDAIDTGHDTGSMQDAGNDADARTTDTGPIDVVNDSPSEASTDAPPDVVDVAVDVPIDVVIDTGAPVPGDTCDTGIDMSAMGLHMYMIDTCAQHNAVMVTCPTPPPPAGHATIFRGLAPSSGSTYQLTVPSGWVIQQLTNPGCSAASFSCGATGSWGVSGATLGGYWYFAIERADGTCGTVTVTINRTM